MKRRYWLDAGHAGDASTDVSLMQVLEEPRHPLAPSPDAPAILEAYTQSAGALSMKNYSPAERARIALNDMELVHPGAHDNSFPPPIRSGITRIRSTIRISTRSGIPN